MLFYRRSESPSAVQMSSCGSGRAAIRCYGNIGTYPFGISPRREVNRF